MNVNGDAKTMKKHMLVSLAVLLVLLVLNPSEVNADILIYSNDFESGSTAGFSGTIALEGTQKYSTLGFGNTFLRNSTVGNPAGSTRLTLTGLPTHDTIDLRFDLAIINSWDGNTVDEGGKVPPDFFNVVVQGSGVVFQETFDFRSLTDGSYTAPADVLRSWRSHLWGTNLGWDVKYEDAAYDMAAEPAFNDIAHTGSTLTIDFFASGDGWQGGDDESWAIDNVEVTVVPVPVPAAFLLGAIGLSAAGLRLRRDKASLGA